MICTDSKIYRWTIRIGKCGWFGIYVGMCQIRKAQQHQFERWNWSNIGQGNYCVRSDGHVFSHSDANVNYKLDSFRFEMGDVLQFEYDSVMGKLTVMKNKSEQYKMNIEKDTTENYAICAFLWNSGDSVELMG